MIVASVGGGTSVANGTIVACMAGIAGVTAVAIDGIAAASVCVRGVEVCSRSSSSAVAPAAAAAASVCGTSASSEGVGTGAEVAGDSVGSILDEKKGESEGEEYRVKRTAASRTQVHGAEGSESACFSSLPPDSYAYCVELLRVQSNECECV